MRLSRDTAVSPSSRRHTSHLTSHIIHTTHHITPRGRSGSTPHLPFAAVDSASSRHFLTGDWFQSSIKWKTYSDWRRVKGHRSFFPVIEYSSNFFHMFKLVFQNRSNVLNTIAPPPFLQLCGYFRRSKGSIWVVSMRAYQNENV